MPKSLLAARTLIDRAMAVDRALARRPEPSKFGKKVVEQHRIVVEEARAHARRALHMYVLDGLVDDDYNPVDITIKFAHYRAKPNPAPIIRGDYNAPGAEPITYKCRGVYALHGMSETFSFTKSVLGLRTYSDNEEDEQHFAMFNAQLNRQQQPIEDIVLRPNEGNWVTYSAPFSTNASSLLKDAQYIPPRDDINWILFNEPIRQLFFWEESPGFVLPLEIKRCIFEYVLGRELPKEEATPQEGSDTDQSDDSAESQSQFDESREGRPWGPHSRGSLGSQGAASRQILSSQRMTALNS